MMAGCAHDVTAVSGRDGDFFDSAVGLTVALW